MVDDDNRTIVVMRYDQRSDVVTVGYSEDNQNWNLVDLTATGLGDWEPTYDADLWKRENKLHLLYQPVGLGSTSSTISVLEWDAKAFFLDLGPPPLSLQVDRSTGLATIANPTDADIAISGYSITSNGSQLDAARWNSLADQATAGWAESQAAASGLAEAASGAPLTLAATGGSAARCRIRRQAYFLPHRRSGRSRVRIYGRRRRPYRQGGIFRSVAQQPHVARRSRHGARTAGKHVAIRGRDRWIHDYIRIAIARSGRLGEPARPGCIRRPMVRSESDRRAPFGGAVGR